MKKLKLIIVSFVVILPSLILAESKIKLDSNKIILGETLTYKATWGILTIGTATTRIDNKIHKVGTSSCYKVEASGQTNGLAKVFYVRDKWASYVDVQSITTHKSTRSIREGNYELDEMAYFDHKNNKASVQTYDKKSKSYQLKKVYDTPDNIRDIVAGFVVIRMMDLNKFSKGERFRINGFYEDEGYNIDVIYAGKEIIKTDAYGKVLCHKIQPIVPPNKVLDGSNSVDLWLAANDSQKMIRVKAKMFVGNFNIELQ